MLTPFEIDEYTKTFKNPRYNRDGNILFDTILSGKITTHLASAQDHHESAMRIFHDAVAGKWGAIAPFEETTETRRQHQIGMVESVGLSITVALNTVISKYQPGYEQIATAILSTGSSLPKNHPLYSIISDFADAHTISIDALRTLVSTVTSIGIINGTSSKVISDVLKNYTTPEDNVVEAISTYEKSANNMIERLCQIDATVKLVPIKIT